MSFFEMGPRKKLCPQNENHWPAASDAMFDHFKELGGSTRRTLVHIQCCLPVEPQYMLCLYSCTLLLLPYMYSSTVLYTHTHIYINTYMCVCVCFSNTSAIMHAVTSARTVLYMSQIELS